MTALSLLFTAARLCVWANCSPDVSIGSHLITLHCDACVGVQVNLKWVWISREIKNVLIGWQPLLAAWFPSDYAISNGPGPPTDECSMESCLKDTPQKSETRKHTHAHTPTTDSHTIRDRVHSHNCQWWTGRSRDFLKWQNGPGFLCKNPSDSFCAFVG